MYPNSDSGSTDQSPRDKGREAYLAGNFERALRCFLEIIAATPDDWQARLCLALLYSKMGELERSEKAVGYLRKYCRDGVWLAKANETLLALSHQPNTMNDNELWQSLFGKP